MKLHARLSALLLALFLTGPAVTVRAQTFIYWTGTGADATAFNSSDNWDSGAPDNSGTAAQIAAINNGTVSLSGAATADFVLVGHQGGTATLNIGSGSSLAVNYLSFGVEEGSAGTGTISNGGSVSAAFGVTVGDDAIFGPALTTGTTGNLTISSGGTVNGSVTVGYGSQSTGTLTVTGAGSTVTSGISSYNGTAHITISNSATVQGGISGGSGSSDITVNSGALVDGGIAVGGNGTGTSSFTVGGGATLINGGLALNAGSGGSATGTITGGNHTTVGSISLGGGGTNQLTVQGGATLDGSANTNTSSLGSSGASNTFTLTGAGTSWTNGGTLYVGSGTGTGTFNVSLGASTTQANLTLGNDSGSSGTMNVSGGSTVTSSVGLVGNSSGGSGTVTISGAGSSWSAGSTFEVASFGTGSVTVANGGALSNSSIATVGGNSGSTGSVTVTGSGSTWTSANAVTVSAAGSGSTGAITLANGGQFTITSGHLRLSEGTGAGTLNIGADALSAAAAPGTLVLGSGSVRSLGSNGTVVFNHTSSSYVFDDSLEFGVKILQKAGTTTLGGPVTGFVYSGGTTISGGTLKLGADNALGTGGLALSGGTLDLNDFSQTAGALNVTGNTFIDFTATSQLLLSDSSALSWSGILTVLNFDGSDSFRVGTTSGGLTGIQLNLIHIGGFYAQIDAAGYLSASTTAIPEPAAYAVIAGLIVLGLAARRHRLLPVGPDR
jgi:T5SS/PEP-CTERM-associated repeat protein